eukprot:CFRG4527T1
MQEDSKYLSAGVSFHHLVRFATTTEIYLLGVASILSMVVGCLPTIFCVLFGSILDDMQVLVNADVPLLLGETFDLDFNQLIGEVENIDVNNIMGFASQFFPGLRTTFLSFFTNEGGENVNKFSQIMVVLISMAGYGLQILDYLDGKVARVALVLVCMGAIGMACGFVSKLVFGTVSFRLGQRVRRVYLESVLLQDISFLNRHTAGELSTLLSRDVKLIEEALGDNMQLFFLLVGLSTSGIVIGFVFSWKLAIATVAMAPMIAIAGAYLSYTLTTTAEKSSRLFAKAGAIAEESLSLIRTVTAFNGQKYERNRFNTRLDDAYTLGVRSHLKNGVLIGVSMFIMLASNAWSLWFASQLIASREISPGDVMTVFFAIVIASLGIGQMFTPVSKISAACGVAHSLYKIIDHMPAINSLDIGGTRVPMLKGNIEFRDVTFAYEKDDYESSDDDDTDTSMNECNVLQDFNLKVEAGSKVAIIGGSGSGKSTTIRLVERLYDPQQGAVYVDGVDLRTLNVQWWRGQIGLVSQEPHLFSGTIADNIAIGSGISLNHEFDADLPMDIYRNRLYCAVHVSREDVIVAAKIANAHGFILKLPKQYDTVIGLGSQLSGGQKQRIAIARAIVRNPKILLLDEATSALDIASEALVQTALQQATHGRTTIIVAHRLSTVRDADTIFVIDGGCVVEQGTHIELRHKHNGFYAQYFKNSTSESVYGRLHEGAGVSEYAHSYKHEIVNERDNSSDSEASVSIHKHTMIAKVHTYGEGKTQDNCSYGDVSLGKESEYVQKDSISVTGNEPEVVTKTTGVKRRVYRLNKPEWPLFALGSVGAALVGLVWPMYAYYFGEIIFLLMQNDQDEVNTMVVKFLVLAIVAFVGNLVNTVCFGYANERLIRRVRRMLFAAFMRQDIAWYDDPGHLPSTLQSRLTSDAMAVTGVTGSYVSTQITLLTALGGALFVGFYSCWQLAFVLFTMVPLLALGLFIGLKTTAKVQKMAYSQLARGEEMGIEAIDEARTILGLGSRSAYWFLDAYEQKLGMPAKAIEKSLLFSSLTFGFFQFVVLSEWGVAFYYGVQLVKSADCDVVGLIRTVCAVIFGGIGVGQVLAVIPNPRAAQLAANWIFNVVDREPLASHAPTKEEKKGKEITSKDMHRGISVPTDNVDLQGDIQFENVQFSYPCRPGTQVLQGLNLHIRKGQVVGVVGESGSGKSTLVSLLERFYVAQGGSVRLDGKKVDQFDAQWLRSQIGLVSQEPHLFSCTVRENLVYGLPNPDTVTEEMLNQCLVEANARTFVNNLPNGLDTLVGEKGGSMSGGMKQRLAIARMLLRNPSIILLDEATSALDTTSERLVQNALNKAMKNRTTIIVAHKLSTLQNVDVVVVVVEGVIKEMGTPSELRASDGLFAEMLKQQNDTT